MNKYFNLFLNTLNINLNDIKNENFKSVNLYNNTLNKKILNKFEKNFNDFEFVLFIYKNQYLPPLDSLNNIDGKIEKKFDVILIINYYDNINKYVYTINNPFYLSYDKIESATTSFKKISDIISNSVSSEELFKSLIEIL